MPAKKQAKEVKKFTIDCSVPSEDGILDVDALENYLKSRIKVNGKTGNLGTKITVGRDGDNVVTVEAELPFSKRSLKYLTKRFLKKATVRDYLRVVAVSKEGYQLKYFKLSHDGEEAEETEA